MRRAAQPLRRAVAGDDAVFQVPILELLDRFGIRCGQTFAIVGMRRCKPGDGIAHHLLGIEAMGLAQACANIGNTNAAIGMQHALVDHAGDVRGDGFVTPFALAQRFFSTLQRSDVGVDADPTA